MGFSFSSFNNSNNALQRERDSRLQLSAMQAEDQLKNYTQNRGSSNTSSSNTNINSGFNGDLQNVFTSLGNIAETKANNDQRRFREDLPFQSNIYQQFDDTADRRRRELQAGEIEQRAGVDTQARNQTEGIDTRAREQNSNLTKDRMRLQSTQNMAEEKNRGAVQVNTTGQTRDADLKRALSVLPRK